MRSSSKHAFLGKSFTRFLILVVFATTLLIIEKVLNLEYVIAQKAVQEGMVRDNWQTYMDLGLCTVGISLVLRAVKVFFMMWVEKIQKINFSDTFNGVIQEDGKMEGANKILVIASAKVNSVIEIVEGLINIVYIIALMDVVTMTLPEYIGAFCILLSGVAFGVLRGNMQAKSDMLGAEIQTLQQKIAQFFMISDSVLNERLKEFDTNSWKRIIIQCIKNTIQYLPEATRTVFFVALFYNITMSGMEEGKIYPYSYVVYTAYGYMVSLASNISNLLEYVQKISKSNRDSEVQAIRAELKLREEELNHNFKNVILENGFRLLKAFTVKLIRPNGEEAFYYVPEDLSIEEGKNVLLEGENGTGKSRLCKILKFLVQRCASYDMKTSIVDVCHVNFKRGKEEIDFNLIKYLANGLALERIPEQRKEFYSLRCLQINSADKQMLIALQILYFAIKDYEEGKKNLIILDEIFSNLSLERTKVVLPFIMSELSKVNACTIIVSHTHKDEVKKYIAEVWQLRNDGDKVIIEAIPA